MLVSLQTPLLQVFCLHGGGVGQLLRFVLVQVLQPGMFEVPQTPLVQVASLHGLLG
jgi:hypothetical protein